MKLPDLVLPRPGPGLTAFHCIALALACVVPLLLEFGYWPFDMEVLVCMAAATLVGGAVAAAGTRWPVVPVLWFAATAGWLIDAYFMPSWYPVWPFALLIGVLCISPHWANARNVLGVFALAFTVLAMLGPRMQVLDPPLASVSPPPDAATDLPLIVHIVLDEQASPAAASAAMRATGLPDRILAGFAARGFSVHAQARTHSGSTLRTLGRLFGPPVTPEQRTENYTKEVGGGFSYGLRRNTYAADLVASGYTVRIIQGGWYSLCAPQAAGCQTHPRDLYGHSMRRYGSRVLDRLGIAGARLHIALYDAKSERQVSAYRWLAGPLVQGGTLPPRNHFWARPVTMLEVMDELEETLPSRPGGEAWIIHLLAPHFPYVLDAGCDLRPRAEWQNPHWITPHDERGQPSVREQAYWEQANCFADRVLALVDRLDAGLGPDRVRLIVHGDHGTRPSTNRFHPEPEEVEVAHPDTALDTIFMARVPGVEPGLHREPVRLEGEFRATVARLTPR